MYRIPSAEENIIMEMPQKKTNLHIFCGTWPKWYFHYNIFKAPDLECIWSALGHNIFSLALPLHGML